MLACIVIILQMYFFDIINSQDQAFDLFLVSDITLLKLKAFLF